MPELVANCPRCGAQQHTCDVVAMLPTVMQHGWQHWYEAFAVCRNCSRSTVFVLSEDTGHDIHIFEDKSPMKLTESLNNYFRIDGYVSQKDADAVDPPDHVPSDIGKIFKEATTCYAARCWNAAGCMFRTCLDLATRPMLPDGEAEGLNSKTRRDLGLRLPWLFANGRLPSDLQDLSTCVREDGNDGAHQGTLTKVEADDLLDFTIAMLERIFTEPKRIQLATKRREERRRGSSSKKSED
jgi:hypothetical protein